MDTVEVTRSEIHEKIKELVLSTNSPAIVKTAIEKWLLDKKASEFDTKQILNDLTSYKEYLELKEGVN